MEALVVYKSKTGFTKRYAEWIAAELNCDSIPFQEITSKNIKSYDLILFGSSIHAGMIGGLKKMKELLDTRNGTLIVFATGATPAAVKDEIEKIWQTNFTKEELKNIPHFYFQSGLNYEKMGFGSRLLMKSMSRMLEKKKNQTNIEEGMRISLIKSHDHSSKESINPLITYVNSHFIPNLSKHQGKIQS